MELNVLNCKPDSDDDRIQYLRCPQHNIWYNRMYWSKPEDYLFNCPECRRENNILHYEFIKEDIRQHLQKGA